MNTGLVFSQRAVCCNQISGMSIQTFVLVEQTDVPFTARPLPVGGQCQFAFQLVCTELLSSRKPGHYSVFRKNVNRCGSFVLLCVCVLCVEVARLIRRKPKERNAVQERRSV